MQQVVKFRKAGHQHTSALGFCAATSTAQSPDPHPQSRILLGFLTGGNISLLSNTLLSTPCINSRRAISSWPKLLGSIGTDPRSRQALFPTSSMGTKYVAFVREYC